MSYIILRNEWEDDDEMLQVQLSASNGALTTTQDFYVYPSDLGEFGKELEAFFPANGKGEVVFEYGSETENFYSFVKLRFFYINLGKIGIHIRTNNKEQGYELAVCEFSIESTLQAVNDLGKKISHWSRNSGEPLKCTLNIA